MEHLDTVSVHVPVLLHEIVSAFVGEGMKKDIPKDIPEESQATLKSSSWYLDGTLGGAGHALAIAKAYEKANGKKMDIIGLDRDPQAIERAKGTLEGAAGKIILECENFRDMDKVLDKNGIPLVDMILLDLGISSDELDESGRGFSFLRSEPLLMTMGDPEKYPFTASTIVNSWKEEDIANVIFGYGEDRYARRIARAIVYYRTKKPIETTVELAEIVKGSIPHFGRGFGGRPVKIHPATKTFQALRIAVNDELGALKDGLAKGYERLAPGGKMAVISFHSLEDRIVKEFFRACADKEAERAVDDHDNHSSHEPLALILTKKPITASPQEIAENPRSRSAKLRIIQKKL